MPRLLAAVLFALAASAQPYAVSTFAGGGLPVNVPGTSASVDVPGSLAVDKAGNVFFTGLSVVLRWDAATGVVTLVAGNGTLGFSGDDGPATKAQLYYPSSLAVDSAGNLYIADARNNRIRKVSNGVITTVAGNGIVDFIGDDGPATGAVFNGPGAIAVDLAGNLYIADSGSRVRKVSNGMITTVAGSLRQGYSGDNGPATRARLNFPSGVAVDSFGNLYIADSGNNRIRKVSNGVITTAAGNGTQDYGGDNGPATSAELFQPKGIAVDAAGNLYIADGTLRIRKVSGGTITTVAGNGTFGYSGDYGPATGAGLTSPSGVAVNAADDLYIADTGASRIRKVSGWNDHHSGGQRNVRPGR